jgi:hypothetical protein
MKKEYFTFDKFLRVLILVLIVLMLIVVVYDRYTFHKLVYNKAATEAAILKEPKDSCSFCLCKHHIDSIAKLQLIRSSAEVANINNNNCETVNIKNKSDSSREIIEKVSSLFSLMKDVDGLISANGITFLISLIVALLIALVTDKLSVIEKLTAEVNNKEEQAKKVFENNDKLQKEVQQTLKDTEIKIEKALGSNVKLQKKVQKSLKDAEIKTAKLYDHLANYDRLLVKVESLFNLSITIGNVTKVILQTSVDNLEIKESLSTEIGILCSRLSLLCDPIEDILNGRNRRIDHLSEDEKNILLTYLEDAKNELEKSRKAIKDNPNLYKIIGGNRRIVENIYGMIETL